MTETAAPSSVCRRHLRLSEGDRVRLTDDTDREFAGEVVEAPDGTDALDRVVRRVVPDGQSRRIGLYAPLTDDGDLRTVNTMANGNKGEVVTLEVVDDAE